MRVYLDHGATSFPKAHGVGEAIQRFLSEAAGNPGRGGHRLTVAASRAVEGAREDVADLLGADPERTLFGPSATFWLNTVMRSRLGDGGRVVTSALEHNAVMRPLGWLAERRGVEVVVVEGKNDTGVPSAGEFAAEVRKSATDLVLCSHASNVTGAVLPVAEIVRAVAPVPVLVDAAQTAGSIPFDFSELGAAALACSGHKGLLGPPGIGVLLLAEDFVVEPLVRGGTGSRSESHEMPDHLPDRLEAGTVNGVGAVGLGAACRWLAEKTIDAVHEHEKRLAGRLVSALQQMPGVRLPGRDLQDPHTGMVSFTVDGHDNGELAAWLDREHGICVRTGLHCSPSAHRRIGTFPDGTIRVGIGPYNDENEIDQLVDAVRVATGGRSQR
jgi:cysteine desulfurase family protein